MTDEEKMMKAGREKDKGNEVCWSWVILVNIFYIRKHPVLPYYKTHTFLFPSFICMMVSMHDWISVDHWFWSTVWSNQGLKN